MSCSRSAAPPPLACDALRSTVDWAICSRRSIRAFLPTPVARADIDAILDVARYCASGVNTQPWQVHVLTGPARRALSEAVLQVYDARDPAPRTEPYDYYPRQWNSPYLERRRQLGWELYGLLGIDKGDRQGMHLQHGRNYRFFDAPVGLVFTIDRQMGRGSLLDYGMFLQSIMLAARARGLDTCVQAAFNAFHEIIAQRLSIPPTQMLVCAMSLGYAAPDSIENFLVTGREPCAAFTTYHDILTEESAS